MTPTDEADPVPNWGSMFAPAPPDSRDADAAAPACPNPMLMDAAYRNRLRKRRRQAELAKASKKATRKRR